MMHPSSTQTALYGALSDWSLSVAAAGFLAVLISHVGPLAIFFQATQAAHVPDAMVALWVWTISIDAAASGIYASQRWKAPVVTVQSALGMVLLVSLFPGLSLNRVIGAHTMAAVVILLIGAPGTLDRLMWLIPKDITTGMMTGTLFQSGTHAFAAASAIPVLALSMIAVYVVGRRWWPRYCIVVVLLAGIIPAVTLGLTYFDRVTLEFTHPVFIVPHWAPGLMLSLAALFAAINLIGQLLPGVAVLCGSGYDTPIKPIMTATSVASISVAFFGGIMIVIVTIIVALCTGRDAHDGPPRRYVAGIINGMFYLIGGTFVSATVMLFAALLKLFIATLTRLALIGAIASNVMEAIGDDEHREVSVVTFLVTASGLMLLGLDSAFWGIVIGSAAAFVLRPMQR